MKKIFTVTGCATMFLAYFVLSLSCATTSGVKRESGTEVSVAPSKTENTWDDYDIKLVSQNPSPSRILKLTKKDDEGTKVYYTVSVPGDTKVLQKVSSNGTSSWKEVDENLVTTSELDGKYLINEDDAKKAVEFINQLEKEFKSDRKGEGVLSKFEVFKVIEYTERVFVPTSVGYTAGYKTENGEYQTVTKKEKMRVFFVQHSTAYGKDEILYSANSPRVRTQAGTWESIPPTVVTLEEILAVRDALSK